MKTPKTRKKTAAALVLGGAVAIGATWFAFADTGPLPVADGGASSAAPANAGATVIAATAGRPAVEVWKSPTCGCCEGWVEYLEGAGFEVVAHDTDDVDAVKTRLGLVDPRLKSCHTATIDGYVVEGHVPVSDIEKLLAERPDVVGISAPGMPMMSPGMGSTEPQDYDVVGFAKDGTTEIFASH